MPGTGGWHHRLICEQPSGFHRRTIRDSFDGYRTSLDLNRVLVKGKLALRANGSFQHDGFVRKPSGVGTERYNAMLKYSPFRSTTITAGVQYYHSYGPRPNFTPPRDNISYWAANRRPTWDPVAQVIHVNGATIGPITAAMLAQFNNISSTQDVTAKGTEIELNLNPTKYWTIAGSVTDTQSINTNVSTELEQYINERYKVWTTIVDQRTNQLWWNTNYGGSQTPAQNFAAYLDSPLHVIRQLEGKTNPQIRRYAAKLSSNLRLSGVTERPYWRNVNVGGAVRWEDRGAIGYYGLQKLPAVITDLDPTNPVYDKSNLGGGRRGNYYFDAFVGYRTRLWANKVGATLQLNVRNLQEGGRLQPIAAFPDGTPSAYRIVDPRQFILTASFDL